MSSWRSYVSGKTTEGWMASPLGRYFIIGLSAVLSVLLIMHLLAGEVPSRPVAMVALDEYFRSDGREQMADMRASIETSPSQRGGIDKFSFHRNVRIVSSNFSPRNRLAFSDSAGSVRLLISDNGNKGEFLIDFSWKFIDNGHNSKAVKISKAAWGSIDTHGTKEH